MNGRSVEKTGPSCCEKHVFRQTVAKLAFIRELTNSKVKVFWSGPCFEVGAVVWM